MTDCATHCARVANPDAKPCYICADEDRRLAAIAEREANATVPLLPPDLTAGEARLGDYELMRLRGD